MKESDIIAPLGIMTLLAALKGRQNKTDAETAYANEVERLNKLALQSQEETEDTGPETDEGGFSFNNLFSDFTSVDEDIGEVGSHPITNQSLGEAISARTTMGLALTPLLKRIVLGGGMNMPKKIALAIPEVLRFGGKLIAPEATAAIEEKIGAGYNEYIDPFVQSYISPVTDAIGEKKAEIIAAQDVEDEIFRQSLIDQGADPNSLYFDDAVKGGFRDVDDLAAYEEMIQSPFADFDDYYADGGRVGLLGLLGYEDGGRVHLRGGGMDASQKDFGKSKKDKTKDTKSKDTDTDNDNKGNKPSQSPNVGDVAPTGPFGAITPMNNFDPSAFGQLGPMGTMAMAMNPAINPAINSGLMDEEDSSPFGATQLGKFNIGDVSVSVDPFGATQLGVTAPIGSVYGLKNLFGYK